MRLALTRCVLACQHYSWQVVAYTTNMGQMSERLREARVAAGYSSASAAARAHGWGVSTYIAHENGQNDYRPDQAQEYAKAFKSSAEWLLWGRNPPSSGIDAELRQLPSDVSQKLIAEFNAMIRTAKLLNEKK